ncbi:hypothetical protein Tco_1163216 [Tanacetum coccineum]
MDDNGSSRVNCLINATMDPQDSAWLNLWVLSYPYDIIYLVYGAMFFIVSDMWVLGALCTISEYADCPELSDISTYVNNPMIIGIVIWAGLLWIIVKVDECYFSLNMSSNISHLDTKDDAKVSLEWEATCMMGMMPINKDVDVWYHWFSCGTRFWKCNRSFSFDDFDDGRCMLNFEVYAGSSSMIMMMGLSIT